MTVMSAVLYDSAMERRATLRRKTESRRWPKMLQSLCVERVNVDVKPNLINPNLSRLPGAMFSMS